MTDWIVPVIVALLAAAPGVFALIQGRSKANADAAEVFEGLAARSGERWKELMQRVDALEAEVKQLAGDNAALKIENTALKTENETLRCEIDELRTEVDSLRKQLESRRR